MTTPPIETCAGICGRPMVRAERDLRPSVVIHRARDLCDRCYKAWHREHRMHIPPRYRPPRIPVPIDEIAVERAVLGDPPATLRPCERLEVVGILTRRGYSAAQIAPVARCTERTVQRHRARLRSAA